MIIDGVAASLIGPPRLTADIDATILLEEASLEAFLTQAHVFDLKLRIANLAKFARKSAMLLLHHEASAVCWTLLRLGFRSSTKQPRGPSR